MFSQGDVVATLATLIAHDPIRVPICVLQTCTGGSEIVVCMQDFCIVKQLEEIKNNYRKGRDQFKIKVGPSAVARMHTVWFL